MFGIASPSSIGACTSRGRLTIMAVLVGCTVFGVLPGYTYGSTSSQIASQLSSIADSANGRKAGRIINAPSKDATIGRLSQNLLRSYGVRLTALQRGLLRVNVLLTNRRTGAALSSLDAGKQLGSKQVALLRKAFEALRHNPAIAILKRTGLALRRNPQRLAKYVRQLSDSSSEFPSGNAGTNNNSVDSSVHELATVVTAQAVRRFEGSMTRILSSRPAIQYIKTLPPMVLASFVPYKDILASNGRTGDKLARAAVDIPFVSPETNALIDYLMTIGGWRLEAWVEGATKIEILPTSKRNLAEYPLIAAATILLGPEGFVAFTGAAVVVNTYLTIRELGEGVRRLVGLYNPVRLKVTPDTKTVKPGEGITYTADAIDALGIDDGPVTISGLSISGGPYAICAGDGCAAREQGPHTVIAVAHGAVGSATLNVKPGPLASLRLEPGWEEIPPGGSATYKVEGLDDAGNDLGFLGPTSPYGSAVLSISPPGSCVGSTCTAAHPGDYMVTARLGNAEGTAQLRVKDDVTITSSGLSDGAVGQPYRETLQASGGAVPYSWSVTSGNLPAGLNLDSSTGEVHGTPTGSGQQTFLIKVTDSLNLSDAKEFSISIVPAPLAIGGATGGTGFVGQYFLHGFSASGGTQPYEWSIVGTEPVDGLSINHTTGLLGGVIQNKGEVKIPIEVRDSAGGTASLEFTVMGVGI